tara:strand:+ start:12046 stop:12222 length:177 start_codon:yes stop_codon:yes gene_type:complete
LETYFDRWYNSFYFIQNEQIMETSQGFSKSIFKDKNYWIGIGVGIATILLYQKYLKKK